MTARIALALGLAALAIGCKGKSDAGPVATVTPAVLWTGGGGQVAVTGGGLLTPAPTGPVQATARLVPVRGLDGAVLAGTPVEVPVTVAVDAGGAVRVTLQVAPAALVAGIHALEVDTTSNGALRLDEAVAALPTPVLGPPEKVYGCVGVASALAVPALAADGTDLPIIDGAGPSASLDGFGGRALPLTLSDCQAVPFSRAAIQVCRRLEALAAVDLPGMETQVAIHWPAPLDAAPEGLGRFSLLPSPALEPGPRLRGKGVAIDVTAGFYLDPARPPTATLGGRPIAFTPQEGCFEVQSLGVSRCAGISLVIPPSVEAGPQALTLTTLPGCTGTTTLDVGPLPVVTSLSPEPVCSGSMLSINGSGFVGPRVAIGDLFTTALACTNGAPEPCDSILFSSSGLPVGTYDLVVTNGTTPPTSSAPARFTVVQSVEAGGPIPTLVSGLAARQVFIPIAAGSGAVVSAVLVPQSPGSHMPATTPLTFTAVAGGIQVTLPAALPKGIYSIAVADPGPCLGFANGLESWGAAVVLEDPFEEQLPQPAWRWPLDGSEGSAGPSVLLAGGEGNPGTAAHAGETATTVPWYFTHQLSPAYPSIDAALLHFDLRVQGSGAPIAAPHVIVMAAANGAAVRLEHALVPLPGAAWTHHELRLDDPAGWMVRDHLGAHAATAEELSAAVLGSLNVVSILGSWTEGTNEAWLDNLALELAR